MNWNPFEEKPRLERVRAGGVEYRLGDRVLLKPGKGGDIVDLALRGKMARIAAIEQDYEDRIHLAVTVEDDPGSDLGAEGKPGHRFYFSPEEVALAESGRGL